MNPKTKCTTGTHQNVPIIDKVPKRKKKRYERDNFSFEPFLINLLRVTVKFPKKKCM